MGSEMCIRDSINLYRKYARYTVPSTTVDETVDSVLALVRRGQDVR